MNTRKIGKRIYQRGFIWMRRTEIEAINNTDPFVICQSTIVLLREKRKIPSIQERWNLARFLTRRSQK